jgi:signal transduction histidine kinase
VSAARARRLLLLVVVPVALLWLVHVLSQQFGTALPSQVVRLTDAQLLPGSAVDPTQVQGAVAPITGDHSTDPLDPPDHHHYRLPLQIHESAAPGPLWFAMDFQMPQAADQPYWLVIQHRPTASIYLDGQLLAHSSMGRGFTAEDEDDFAQRGLLLAGRRMQVSIPPALLGAGPHRLSVRLVRPGFEGAGLSAPLLGPAPQMRALQEGRRLWQGVRVTTALGGAAIGVFMVLVWLALRQEWLYGVTGLFCLCLAVLLSPYLLNGALLPAPWWRVALDVTDVVAKGLLLFLVARLTGNEARWLLRAVGAYLALGILIDGTAAVLGWSWTDFNTLWPWWALGSRSLVLLAAAVIAARAALDSDEAAPLVGALVVALSGWVWLYVSYFALVASQQLNVVDINVIGHAVLIAMAGVALQRRFVRSLRDQALARTVLERALEDRSRELQARWQELQDSERQRTAAEERERLLQEMHDGLGSQLVTARLSAERGVPSETLVEVLDECIREMRLTVDALAVTDGDLTLLLANLRHRMGPRLSAAGLTLDWQLADVPLVPVLRGTGGRELIRIVQECLSNVIHHARATRIRFATRLDDDGGGVSLLITDDGCGLSEHRREGHGLRGMRRRAARISARIEWRAPTDSPETQGTELVVWLPLR